MKSTLTVRICVAAALLLTALPAPASADGARVQALGGVDLLIEDSSDIFTNPGLIGRYTNRVWVSLGITGGGGTLGFAPLGGGAVRLGQSFDLGVVLNRSPQAYDFGNALWPVASLYLPNGPGGPLGAPDSPPESSAPLRFPVDLFFGFGRDEAPARAGLNIYYAAGAVKTSTIEYDETTESERFVNQQTHLVNVTFGVAGNQRERVRPEGWLRIGDLTASSKRKQVVGSTALQDGEVLEDRFMALDADVRAGGGFRLHIGDREAHRGVVVSPGLQYDFAIGWFHFRDEFDSSDSERTVHAPAAHHLRAGLGVNARLNDLRLVGTLSVVAQELRERRTQARDGYEERDSTLDITVPDLSVGAEYRVLPALLVRAGLRTAIVGGRRVSSTTRFEEAGTELVEVRETGTATPLPATVGVEAHGGLALELRRFTLDVTAGGAFLGEPGAAFFGRMDLSFDFR